MLQGGRGGLEVESTGKGPVRYGIPEEEEQESKNEESRGDGRRRDVDIYITSIQNTATVSPLPHRRCGSGRDRITHWGRLSCHTEAPPAGPTVPEACASLWMAI